MYLEKSMKHKMKDGSTIEIPSMTDTHLNNTMFYIEKLAKTGVLLEGDTKRSYGTKVYKEMNYYNYKSEKASRDVVKYNLMMEN